MLPNRAIQRLQNHVQSHLQVLARTGAENVQIGKEKVEERMLVESQVGLIGEEGRLKGRIYHTVAVEWAIL